MQQQYEMNGYRQYFVSVSDPIFLSCFMLYGDIQNPKWKINANKKNTDEDLQ